jgi:uncharacterized membrane protein YjfL (UPF0719 family)
MSAVTPAETIVRSVVEILPYIGIFLVLNGVFHVVSDFVTPFVDRVQRALDNKAAAWNRFGATLGFNLALTGSLFHREPTVGGDLGMFMLDGIVALAVFIVAHYVLDMVILWGVNNSREIEKGNMPVAIVESCAYVAIGLVVCASFTGGGQSLAEGLLSAVAFSFIALLTISAVYVSYVLIRYKLTGCHIDREVANGNMAASIDAGSLLLAMGFTLWFSIYGDSAGWTQDLLSYAIAAGSSIFVLFLVRMAITAGWRFRGVAQTTRGRHHGKVAQSMQLGAYSIAAGLMAGLVTFI